jgi:hypothetical protein
MSAMANPAQTRHARGMLARVVDAPLGHARSHRGIALLWLGAMTMVAVGVPVLVWGTHPARGPGGALAPALRPWAGLAYAAGLVGAEVLFCVVYRLRRGVAWVLGACAAVDLVFWAAHTAGRQFPSGAAAAVTAGVGAVTLAAGTLGGWLIPLPRPPRRGP